MHTHDELVELVFNLPRFAEIDFDLIDSMPDRKLREILGFSEPSAPPTRKNKRGRIPKPRIKKPHRVDCTFLELNEQLVKRETWRRYALTGQWVDDTFDIPCGARVTWRGRTVNSNVVLHWLRTGEVLPRMSKPRKPYRGRVRVGDALVHLGYFSTAEDRDAAVLSFKLSNPKGDK